MLYGFLLIAATVAIMFSLFMFLKHIPNMVREHKDFQGYCDCEIAKIEAKEKKLTQMG